MINLNNDYLQKYTVDESKEALDAANLYFDQNDDEANDNFWTEEEQEPVPDNNDDNKVHMNTPDQRQDEQVPPMSVIKQSVTTQQEPSNSPTLLKPTTEE